MEGLRFDMKNNDSIWTGDGAARAREYDTSNVPEN